MDKRYLWVVAAVVVVLLIIWGGSNKNNNSEESPSPSSSASTSVQPSPTPSSSSSDSTLKTYTDYVNAYQGRRIQFDKNCQAQPSSITVKNGDKLLFDNRSGEARTIKVGDRTWSFVGYGYKVLTMTSKTLPGTLMLNCGSAVNVGQVIVQK